MNRLKESIVDIHVGKIKTSINQIEMNKRISSEIRNNYNYNSKKSFENCDVLPEKKDHPIIVRELVQKDIQSKVKKINFFFLL